jgi:hypothetical protein
LHSLAFALQVDELHAAVISHQHGSPGDAQPHCGTLAEAKFHMPSNYRCRIRVGNESGWVGIYPFRATLLYCLEPLRSDAISQGETQRRERTFTQRVTSAHNASFGTTSRPSWGEVVEIANGSDAVADG